MKVISLLLLQLQWSVVDLNIRDIILYQVVTDRFLDKDEGNNLLTRKGEKGGYHGGDFAGIRDKLGYLNDLGVNSIWISPVLDNVDEPVTGAGFEDWGYHGYWPDDLFGIEENFGTLEELRDLIIEAEGKGIRTIIDVVVNHVGYGSRWEGRPDLVRGECGPATNPLTACLFGLPDFMTEKVEVRNLLIDIYSGLKKNTGCHGFRIDAARHVDMEFLKAFRDSIKGEDRDFILMGEVWGGGHDNEVLIPYFSAGVFDTAFDFSFRDYVKGFLLGRLRAEALHNYLKRGEGGTGPLLNFLNNHDTPGLLHELGGDRERFRLGLTLLFTLPGIPVLYYGDEVARAGGEWPENRSDMVWEGGDRDTFDHVKRLIGARRGITSLRRGGIRPIITEGGLYAFYRKAEGGRGVFVVVNRGEESREVRIVLPEGERGKGERVVKEWLSERIFTIPAGEKGLVLHARGLSSTILTIEGEKGGKGMESFTLSDPSGDDYGPGSYTYPVNNLFGRGDFDLRELRVAPSEGSVTFEVLLSGRFIVEPVRVYQDRMEEYLFQTLDIYIDTDGISGSGFRKALPGRNLLIHEDYAWEKGILVSGLPFRAMGRLKRMDREMRERFFAPPLSSLSISGGRCRFTVPEEFTGRIDSKWGLVVVLSIGEFREGYDVTFRERGGRPSLFTLPVRPIADEFAMGGGDSSAFHPAVIDILDRKELPQRASLSSFDPERGVFATIPGMRPAEEGVDFKEERE